MYGAFTNKPDFTPFTAVPNRTSLTAGLRDPADLRRGHPGAAGRRPPQPSDGDGAGGPSRQVAAQWEPWKSQQRTDRAERACRTTPTRRR